MMFSRSPIKINLNCTLRSAQELCTRYFSNRCYFAVACCLLHSCCLDIGHSPATTSFALAMLQIPATEPPTLRPLQFRIHAQATHNNNKVSPATISNELFSVCGKSSYCNLNNAKLTCPVDVSSVGHIDNVVITLSAVEERTDASDTSTTTNTFASVKVNVGDYRAKEHDTNKCATDWSRCCGKKNKYAPAETSMAMRGTLKFGLDAETQQRKRQAMKSSRSSDLEKLVARWRTGYMAFRIKGSNLPTKLPTNTSLKTSAVTPSTADPAGATIDIHFTLKTLMRTQQTSSTDELERINIESDRKRFVKDRQTLGIIVGIVVLFLISGAIFYPLVEGWTVLDAFYFGVTTLTTVGYGDMGPTSDGAKIFTALYVFSGVAIVATCIGVATTFLIETAALRAEVEKRKRREEEIEDSDDDDDDYDDEDDNEDVVIPLQQEDGRSEAAPLRQSCVSRCCKRCTFLFSEFLPALICCTIGILVMMWVEEVSFVDAFYWSIVTGTTVGYGDVSPLLPATRGFALLYLFVAVITMGKALSAFGSLLDSGEIHVYFHCLKILRIGPILFVSDVFISDTQTMATVRCC